MTTNNSTIWTKEDSDEIYHISRWGDGYFDINGNPVSTNSLKVTNEGASLGRVLFYDKKLSLNNTISCGTCHQQDKAFTDGLALSKGFEGRITSRSTMAIMNPIAQRNLFWDSRRSYFCVLFS